MMINKNEHSKTQLRFSLSRFSSSEHSPIYPLFSWMTLFLNDEDDALNVIHKFSIFYGLEVNKTKSHAIIWTHFFFFSVT